MTLLVRVFRVIRGLMTLLVRVIRGRARRPAIQPRHVQRPVVGDRGRFPSSSASHARRTDRARWREGRPTIGGPCGPDHPDAVLLGHPHDIHVRVVQDDAWRLLARHARLSWNIIHPHRRREMTAIVRAQRELDVGASCAARRPDGSDPRAIGSKRRVRIRAVRHGENDPFGGPVAAANQRCRCRDAEDRDHRLPTVSAASHHR